MINHAISDYASVNNGTWRACFWAVRAAVRFPLTSIRRDAISLFVVEEFQ